MLAEKSKSKQSISRLQFNTLGRFEIFQNGKGYYNISARSTKSWYLFKYLLSNKGKAIPPEIILENLYPDEIYENPKNTLQNFVYRLRKLLNQEDFFNNHSCNIIFTNGCYSLCFDDDVLLDTDIFEEYTQKAEYLKNTKPNEAIECYEYALKIYCGDYFPELIYEDWVIPRRNYYRRLYIHTVLSLVKLYQQKNEYDRIIKICEKAIQVEPYEEGLHISFMENLIEKNKVNEAQNHYEFYTSMLYKQFGIKPTTELQQIYKLLKKSGAQLNKKDMVEKYLEDANATGAFYCDKKLFNSIFVLEKRRSERTGDIVFIVSITIDENENLFNTFRKTLITSLRKGDVVTTWDNNVLLVLLPKMDYKQIITITDRIINQFKKDNNNNDYKIKVKTHTVFPITS